MLQQWNTVLGRRWFFNVLLTLSKKARYHRLTEKKFQSRHCSFGSMVKYEFNIKTFAIFASVACMALNEATGLEVQRYNISGVDRNYAGAVKEAQSKSESLTSQVRTTSGIVLGVKTSYASVFHAIPYAVPPVKELRFQDPIPYYNTSHTHDGRSPNYVTCYQPFGGKCTDGSCTEVNEDCLVLNVNVPEHVDLTNWRHPPRDRLPVMFWIHGGGFTTGAGTRKSYDGKYLSQVTNTVIVSINYRLGPLGFLVYDDGEHRIKGNQGFKDQQLALLWVKKNIRNFGGDPQNITIFGQSAGAQSVSFHLISTRSDELFQRAIMESPPSAYVYSSKAEAINMTKELVKFVRCRDEVIHEKTCCQQNTSEYDCLMETDAENLIHGMEKIIVKSLLELRIWDIVEPFRPYIDGEEITDQPEKLFRQGKWQKHKPFIIGTNEEELDVFKYFNPFDFAVGPDLYRNLNIGIFGKELGDKISDKYEHMDAPVKDYGLLFGNEMTDFVFGCPSRAIARSASRTSLENVYMYVFSHGMDKDDCRLYFKLIELELCGHSYHAAEIPFLFRRLQHMKIFPDGKDLAVSDQFSTYWGSFARTGSPNHGLENPLPGKYPNWTKFYDPAEIDGTFYPDGILAIPTESNIRVDMRLDVPFCHLENDYRKEICDFRDGVMYDEYTPKVISNDVTNFLLKILQDDKDKRLLDFLINLE